MKATRRTFAEIVVGDEASFEVVLDESLVGGFSELTGDRNPLHVDPAYAGQTMFGGPIAHGMLVASHFSTLVGMYLPGAYGVYLAQDVRFLKPVRVGETVRIQGTVVATSAATRVLTIRTQALNMRGELIVDGEAKVMVLESRTEQPLPDAPASFSLSGRVALVTGASRGIGAATASLLARHGASVVVNYRVAREEAETVERAIAGFGGKAAAIQADVADGAAVKRMFAEATTRLGPVDIVINNASAPLRPAAVESNEWTDFERDFAVIVGGAYHCVQAALPSMLQTGSGVIVNVLSANVLGSPQPNIAGYVTAKHALLGFTRALAAELGPRHIRVNAVAPGLTETALTAHLPPRVKEVTAHQTPLRRIANPIDTARAIVFLASDVASFLSGVCLPVTGGAVMA